MVQRYFEPCWFKIYNYFFHIYYIASKVTAYWRWSIGVKKQQKTGFFDSNELPHRGCNFWCIEALEKWLYIWNQEASKYLSTKNEASSIKGKKVHFFLLHFSSSFLKIFESFFSEIIVLWDIFSTTPSLLRLKHWLRNGKQNKN